MTFTLLPAVDVADGQAVRLVQGEAGTETGYGDPLDAALAWQRDGAEWIHLVDLDAAFGRGTNAELLADVVGQLDVAVELSGGIRDDASLERALATGCARVNLGTAALENPQWCARAIAAHGERIAVGLDVKIKNGEHRLAARGWTTDGGDLWETLERLDRDGCARYVVTDVGKDGTLEGPERRPAARRRRGHARAGDRVRRDRRGVRPGRAGAGRRRGGEHRGLDRREGAVRGPVHAARGAGGRARGGPPAQQDPARRAAG